MEFKNLKIDIEAIYLILVFGLLLWMGYGSLSGYKISHDTLIGYYSSDAIQDYVFVDGIKDTGNYKYFPPWVSAGFNDTIAWYSPAVFELFAMVSYLSGLGTHDVLLLMVYLFGVISTLVMYFTIRDYNKNIAIISLPFMFYMFMGKSYGAFLSGFWAYTIACMFVVAVFWSMGKLYKKKSYILLALFITGIIYTHISELIYIVGFIGFFLGFRVITKNATKDMFKNIILAGIITIIMSAYFILLFRLSVGAGIVGDSIINVNKPYLGELHGGIPVVDIKSFGILFILIIFGMLISLKQFKSMHISFLAGFYMLFVGYSNYLGGTIGNRGMQNRYFWPLYFAVFFGICIYFLVKLIFKNWKKVYSICLSILLLIPLVGFNYSKPGSYSIIEKERLNGLSWFHSNSPKDAKVFFFYGDPYSQTSILWLTKRTAYLVQTEDYIRALNEKKIKRSYLSRDVAGFLFHRTSFLTSGDYTEEYKNEFGVRERDICNYDYFVFDKVSRQPELAQFNMIMASKLAENENIEVVFSNNIMVILENKKPEADCIEEQTIA